MTAIVRRRTVLILGGYAAAVAAWTWFGTRVVPAWIAEPGEGSSPAWIGRILATYAGERPTEHVLKSWGETSAAISAALGLHGLLVLAVGRWARRDGLAARLDAWLDRATAAVLVVAGLAFLLATACWGAVQDYHLHILIWNEVLAGHDPWFLVVGGYMGSYSLNAYGPLFNLLALPTLWNPLASKLILAASYWLFASWTVLAVGRRRGLPAWAGLLMAIWLAGPFAWVEIAAFGHFDVLVAILAVAAIEARVRDRWAASALWLAGGVLLKFFPGVLAPFLALDRGRVRWKYLIGVAGTSAAGMATACAIWGPTCFRPIGLAIGRESAYLSIFRSLRGIHSPIQRDTLFFSPDDYAGPILLFALFKAWSWVRRTGFEPFASGILALTTTLALYKVGFPQYYMVLYLAAAYWFARDYRTLARRGPLATAFVASFGLITWFDHRIVHETINPLVEWIGVPMFAFMVALVAAIVAAGSREGVESAGGDAEAPPAG